MNRREFIGLFASGALATLITQLSWKTSFAYEEAGDDVDTVPAPTQFPIVPEFVKANELTPNADANLVNAVVVPESLLIRTNQEKVKMAVDFRSTFNKDNPDVLLNNLWGYGESVKDAIRRGQEVWLVLDIPDNVDQVSLEDLARYFSALAKEYSTIDAEGDRKTARFVIGNELNAYPKTRAESYLHWYAKVYVHAVLSMKKVSPNIQIFPYAEAYYDSGKTLDTSLALIKQEFSLLRPSDELVDTRDEPINGLCFHYYDDKTGIRERAMLYHQLAEKHGFPPFVNLLELGKPEKTQGIFTTLDHQVVIVRNLAEALALVNEGVINSVFWHTAENVVDPNDHALFLYENGNLIPKPQFYTFQTMGKLLHHDVSWNERPLSDRSSEVAVSGLTSVEDRVKITWIRTKNIEGQILSESSPEIKVYPASKLSINRLLRSSLRGILE